MLAPKLNHGTIDASAGLLTPNRVIQRGLPRLKDCNRKVAPRQDHKNHFFPPTAPGHHLPQSSRVSRLVL